MGCSYAAWASLSQSMEKMNSVRELTAWLIVWFSLYFVVHLKELAESHLGLISLRPALKIRRVADGRSCSSEIHFGGLG